MKKLMKSIWCICLLSMIVGCSIEEVKEEGVVDFDLQLIVDANTSESLLSIYDDFTINVDREFQQNSDETLSSYNDVYYQDDGVMYTLTSESENGELMSKYAYYHNADSNYTIKSEVYYGDTEVDNYGEEIFTALGSETGFSNSNFDTKFFAYDTTLEEVISMEEKDGNLIVVTRIDGQDLNTNEWYLYSYYRTVQRTYTVDSETYVISSIVEESVYEDGEWNEEISDFEYFEVIEYIGEHTFEYNNGVPNCVSSQQKDVSIDSLVEVSFVRNANTEDESIVTFNVPVGYSAYVNFDNVIWYDVYSDAAYTNFVGWRTIEFIETSPTTYYITNEEIWD